MSQPRPLKSLLLIHELIFVLLVVLAGAAGGYGIHLWRAASAESVRISQLTLEIQQTRGDLYRQMKELFDAQFLADREAQAEYDGYTLRIEASFRRLESLAVGSEEVAVIADMRMAYASFLTETRGFLTGGTATDHQALEKAFNTNLELNLFRHYETVTSTAEHLFTRKEQEIHLQLKHANQMAMVLLAIPAVIAVALLWFSRTFLQRAIARPLDAVLRAAQEIGAGKLEQKVPEAGAAELATLAATINRMAEELRHSQEALLRSEKQAAQGALVPVLAHNIRNPLASIRATAQVADDPALDADTRDALKGIIGTVDRLERWLGSLLTYLHPLKPQLSSTTLAALVEGALSLLEPKLKEKNVTVAVAGCDLPTATDVHLMEQAIYNLLLNALEASPAGAAIEVQGSSAEKRVTLIIADHGTGMPFAPEFNTLTPGPSTKRFGTGLGIPFAHKVCETHGGSITFVDREGGGTLVRLSW